MTTLSAGMVVVHRFAGEWHFLLLRAYRNWDFPKGLVERGELPLEAARREAAEEAGITDLHLTWGETYRETRPYGRSKVARYYFGETLQEQPQLPVNPELGHPEHHEARWVKADEAATLLPPRLQPILAWAIQLLRNNTLSDAD